MFRQLTLLRGAAGALALASALAACGKVQPQRPVESSQIRAEAKRLKDACASTTAYDRMKRVLFIQAGGELGSHKSNLATLEQFAFVRMEDPVVEGFDPTLDLTRCRGRFILDVPPGSAQAFGGEHQLQADITYTAQGAADSSGLVYAIHGAEPIVNKLAAFNLADATYRPLPALDAETPAERVVDVAGIAPPETTIGPRPAPTKLTASRANAEQFALQEQMPAVEPKRVPAREIVAATSPAANSPDSLSGEDTVRVFYRALGTGNGDLASAQVIPAKRSSRAYSPDAISRFYGRLSETLRLISISALPGDTYRVSYRYAGTGARCNGTATVKVTSTGGRPLIRSITADGGC